MFILSYGERKSFYNRLKKSEYLSFTGLKGETTMSRVSVSVHGKIRELGTQKAKKLFDKNKYIYEIYPAKSIIRRNEK